MVNIVLFACSVKNLCAAVDIAGLEDTDDEFEQGCKLYPGLDCGFTGLEGTDEV